MKLPRKRTQKKSRKSPVPAYSKGWLDSMYELQSKVVAKKSWLDAVKLPDFCLLGSTGRNDDYQNGNGNPGDACITSSEAASDSQTSADGSTTVQINVMCDPGPSKIALATVVINGTFGSDNPSCTCLVQISLDDSGNLVMTDVTAGGCQGAQSGQTTVYPSVYPSGNSLTFQAYAYSPGNSGLGIATPLGGATIFFSITSDPSQC